MSAELQHLIDPRIGWKATPDEAIDRRFDAAWRSILAGDYENARRRLDDILVRDANYAPANLAQAAMELQQGHDEAARTIVDPIAMRYPRGAGTGARPKAQPKLLEIGKAEVVRHGQDVALFGLGNMFSLAEETAKRLEEQGFSVALINPRWIKPLDVGTLEFFARRVEVICTFEDHVLHNGFGCAVMEHLHSQMINTPVVRIGWPDQFIEHGAVPILRKKHGITADALVEKVLPLLSKKSKLTPSVA